MKIKETCSDEQLVKSTVVKADSVSCSSAAFEEKKNGPYVCSHASPHLPISVVVRMHHCGAACASQRCEHHHTAQHALLTRCCGKVIGLKLTT